MFHVKLALDGASFTVSGRRSPLHSRSLYDGRLFHVEHGVGRDPANAQAPIHDECGRAIQNQSGTGLDQLLMHRRPGRTGQPARLPSPAHPPSGHGEPLRPSLPLRRHHRSAANVRAGPAVEQRVAVRPVPY